MAQTNSFDVSTGVDLQEVDNAVNQAQKEIAQRYDFKGSKASIDFKRGENAIVLVADDEYKMRALFDVLQAKLIKRAVPVKNLDLGEIRPAGGDTVRREIKLKTALDSDTARKVAAAIKEAKLKKVQAAIQGDQVRVSSPSKDDLQEAMALLRWSSLRRENGPQRRSSVRAARQRCASSAFCNSTEPIGVVGGATVAFVASSTACPPSPAR